jgi:UDP-glucose 4-epimerase
MNTTKQTILLTGGAGYIGSHTAYLLAQKGYDVVILDSLVHGQSFKHSWATLIKGDCADANLLHQIFSSYTIAAVMHFAAFIDVGESVRSPLAFYDNNVAKTLRLLEVMRTHNIARFIFSSSCAIYGAPEFIPLTEEHPKNPISPYGKSKLMVEMILEDLQAAYGLQYVSLRYFNAAGALPEQGLGERHVPETHVIPLLLHAAQHKKPFTIFGTEHQTKDGTCVRDYVHVLDIAQAHILALEHLLKQLPSDHFNLGTGSGFSVKELVQAVTHLTGIPLKTILAKARPGDPALLIADPTKANTILGWKPTHSQLDYIIKTAYIFACNQ